jgi:serine/threonine protein kinase
MTSIREKEPPPFTSYNGQTPPELQQIITKALRKEQRERYQSASEMLQALKNLRRKLEALLRAHERLGSFLEEPPTGTSVE